MILTGFRTFPMDEDFDRVWHSLFASADDLPILRLAEAIAKAKDDPSLTGEHLRQAVAIARPDLLATTIRLIHNPDLTVKKVRQYLGGLITVCDWNAVWNQNPDLKRYRVVREDEVIASYDSYDEACERLREYGDCKLVDGRTDEVEVTTFDSLDYYKKALELRALFDDPKALEEARSTSKIEKVIDPQGNWVGVDCDYKRYTFPLIQTRSIRHRNE